jgi:uncharacterized protein (DUF924 family)
MEDARDIGPGHGQFLQDIAQPSYRAGGGAQSRMAKFLAQRAIERGFDMDLPKDKRRWLYMPFMHSEDLADQDMSVELFTRSELSASLPFAVEHADIIRRFGRFPHRNAILGRETTPEEAAYLAGGGFSGVTADGPDETQH